MPRSLTLDVAGESLALHADRAVYWPARRRLLIADLHLGKGDVFRRAGIAVPRGGTSHDLARLAALIVLYDAREVFVLGDLLHGPTPDAQWRQTWSSWRAHHRDLRFAVIAGNHDRALASADMVIELLDDAFDDAPFRLRHHPQAQAARHVICGHIHPCFSVPGIGRRWPGFWLRQNMLVLPAFSAFTGGERVQLAAGDRGALCVEGSLVAIG